MYRNRNYSYFLFEYLENIVLTILCNYDYDIIFLLSDSYYSIFIFGLHYYNHYYFWSENNPKAHKILMNVSYCIANKFLGGILFYKIFLSTAVTLLDIMYVLREKSLTFKSYFSIMSFDLLYNWFMWHFSWQVHTINFLQKWVEWSEVIA